PPTTAVWSDEGDRRMSTKNIIVDPGTAIDQSERDQLPDYDTARGSSYAPRHKRAGLPWQAWVCFCVGFFGIGGYLVVRFVAWLSSVSAETSALDVWLVAFAKVVLFAAPLAFIVPACYWLYQKAAAARVLRLQNNMPIARRHIERDDWQPA